MWKELDYPEMPVIALIGGTGKEGPGLALRWANAGYKIIIGSRKSEKAQMTAEKLNVELNIESISGFENGKAVQQADICVLTVKYTAHEDIINSLKRELQGKILVDATARVDFRYPKPPQSPSAARLAQDILGANACVVAAFQNVPAHTLRSNLEKNIDTAVLVCSDYPQAAEEIIKLANNGGMRAYYAGDLDNAIVVEGLTSILINLNKYYQVKSASIEVTGIPDQS